MNTSLDDLIDYFANLQQSESLDLDKLHGNLFKTCAQNFLSGKQKRATLNEIRRLKSELEKWDQKWLPLLDDPHYPDSEKAYLPSLRSGFIQFQSLSYYVQSIIFEINDKPRKQWIIQERRYIEEITANIVENIDTGNNGVFS